MKFDIINKSFLNIFNVKQRPLNLNIVVYQIIKRGVRMCTDKKLYLSASKYLIMI